jgi:flagellar biosynthesis protein FliQ
MMSNERQEVMKFWAHNLVKTSPEGVVPEDKRNEAVEDFEVSQEAMKKLLSDALQRNTITHTMIVSVNLVMVGIGVGFVLLSIGYSVANNTINEITLSFAGLAVADFSAIFLINPQERIKKSLTNYVQLGIICHSWSNRTQASFMLFLNSPLSEKDVQLFQKTIDEIADDAVHDIQESVEK